MHYIVHVPCMHCIVYMYPVCIALYMYPVCIALYMYPVCIALYMYPVCIALYMYPVCIALYMYPVCIALYMYPVCIALYHRYYIPGLETESRAPHVVINTSRAIRVTVVSWFLCAVPRPWTKERADKKSQLRSAVGIPRFVIACKRYCKYTRVCSIAIRLHCTLFPNLLC